MSFISLAQSYNNNIYNIKDNIYIIQQFYIPENINRYNEIKYCLKCNCNNINITKIFLLNERVFSKDELGLTDKEIEKIEQISIKKRLTYKHTFLFTKLKKLKGYIVLSNSDIFFDNTLINLYKTPLSIEKSIMCQLRFEYDPTQKYLQQSKLFTEYISFSQDTWIYHTNYTYNDEKDIFNFRLGIPGCDNKVMYLFQVLGYKIINDPYLVKIYHYHTSNSRTYTSNDRLTSPFMKCFPILPKINNIVLSPSETYFYNISDNYLRYNITNENMTLFNAVTNYLMNNELFIIPRIAGIENIVAYLADKIDINDEAHSHKIKVMKNNAGINITSNDSLINYSNLYFEAFKKSKHYFDWEIHGSVYKGIRDSHDYISNIIAKNKKPIWAFSLDIFHSIYTIPWTHSLRGKHLLIISAFKESIEEKINNNILDKIYGINLFPNCTFTIIKPPQTQGDNSSMDWKEEFDKFTQELNTVIMNNNIDVALVSSGGYGNLICNYLYDNNISSIYVGGVLQMYFGILGTRWEKERPEIVKLYYNEHWSRPKDNEKPSNFNNVESSCYW